MGLSVKERGEFVATCRYVHVNLMETLAAWVPTTPEMEVKLLFGEHIWDLAQHADALGKRTIELRLKLHHSLEPSEPYVEVLTTLASAKETAQRIVGFYDVMLPGLGIRCRRYLDQTDHLMDAPTVRIVERILDDQTRMIRASDNLRHELTKVRLTDGKWVENLSKMESAVDSFIRQQSENKIAAGAQ
jgi:hypothetical protein